jgi:deazaflavin-dependent oxidoreductase (nitroreductase family)
MSSTSPTASSAHGTRRKPAFLSLTRVFNKLVMPFAGTRVMPLYGVIEHRGRRSGKVFHTPVVVRPIADGFIVPMPWGETTDWFRNIRAAGGCTIRWKGRSYTLTQPEVLDTAGAQSAFGGFQRSALRRFGIQRVLRLRFT